MLCRLTDTKLYNCTTHWTNRMCIPNSLVFIGVKVNMASTPTKVHWTSLKNKNKRVTWLLCRLWESSSHWPGEDYWWRHRLQRWMAVGGQSAVPRHSPLWSYTYRLQMAPDCSLLLQRVLYLWLMTTQHAPLSDLERVEQGRFTIYFVFSLIVTWTPPAGR